MITQLSILERNYFAAVHQQDISTLVGTIAFD